MRVFISWSGAKSRDVAVAFHEWLPLVLHSVEPFVSSKDILAGTRWQAEVASELDETDFGLICVTRQNVSAPWLNFEAGALAKAVDSSRVIPLAVDLSPAEVPNPLGQFQASTLKKGDVEATVRSINEACGAPIPEANLAKTFEKWWPDLELVLLGIESGNYEVEHEPTRPERSEREMLEEVLDSIRGIGRNVGNQALHGHAQTPKMFEDLESLARLHNVGIRSMTHFGGEDYKVSFRDPPTEALMNDIERLELLSGERIDVRLSPDSPDDTPVTPPA